MRAGAWLLAAVLSLLPSAGFASGCVACHADQAAGQQGFHAVDCVACHAGDADASEQGQAHTGLIGFPGNLANASSTCGQCHAGEVEAVHGHAMTTARGMVATTRRVLGHPDDGAAVTALGDGLADSLLRKLCAGCHLGRERTSRQHSTLQRGGGCLACHLDDYPTQGHVRLTRKVSDARCFGCHSRSGRISLNYVGLAEVDETKDATARLPDRRLVVQREADVHHRAGMACIDCHTQQGLMGVAGTSGSEVGRDIQCRDCHGPWPEDGDASAKLPLAHVRHGRKHSQLTGKLSGKTQRIPRYRLADHPYAQQHRRLSCDACHAQWVPQCFGCHIDFDPQGAQHDYLAGEVTPGRWRERRWRTESGLPALGVDGEGHVVPFIPGMILTLEHPDLTEPLFRRVFAPLSPHTTGKSRSCQSCHCDPVALGLGTGQLRQQDGAWQFTPAGPVREDGLAEDAWQAWGQRGRADSSQVGARPLRRAEVDAVLGACQEPEPGLPDQPNASSATR